MSQSTRCTTVLVVTGARMELEDLGAIVDFVLREFSGYFEQEQGGETCRLFFLREQRVGVGSRNGQRTAFGIKLGLVYCESLIEMAALIVTSRWPMQPLRRQKKG